MIVAIAYGLAAMFTFNPKEQAATITAYIVQVTMGTTSHTARPYQSIFARRKGLAPFTMTLGFNLVGI